MGTFNRLHLIRQVDLFTLRLFLSAVEEQQIGRAAIRENIAASTATKRIQDLEDIAGVKLLDRGPKGVVPSPAGAVMVRYVRMILDNIEGLRSEISAFSEGIRGKIVVASERSVIIPFLAQALAEYALDFPMVELVLRELDNTHVVEVVSRGEADVGVFAMAHQLDLSGLDLTPYRQDRLVVVVPTTHHLVEQPRVSFADLLSEDIIAIDATEGAFQAATKRLGRVFVPKYSVKSAGVAISLVQAMLGVTVLPESLVRRDVFVFDRVTSLELAEPWAVRSVHIGIGRGRTLGQPAQALVRQLLDRPRDEAAS